MIRGGNHEAGLSELLAKQARSLGKGSKSGLQVPMIYCMSLIVNADLSANCSNLNKQVHEIYLEAHIYQDNHTLH